MTDWYLGQAGFGEQLERYGDAYWRQMGGTLLWVFIAIWALLVFIAIIVTLARHAEAREQAASERAFARTLAATHTGALVPRGRVPRPLEPAPGAHSDDKAVPSKVA